MGRWCTKQGRVGRAMGGSGPWTGKGLATAMNSVFSSPVLESLSGCTWTFTRKLAGTEPSRPIAEARALPGARGQMFPYLKDTASVLNPSTRCSAAILAPLRWHWLR